MSLDDLAHAFQEKGLARPAVLLRSKAALSYLSVLARPQWRERVEGAVGPELYRQLLAEREKEEGPEGRMLQNIFGIPKGKRPWLKDFLPYAYRTEPLRVHIDSQFDFSTLQKAAEVTKQVAVLTHEAHLAVYGEVKERTKDDENLLYEMYKDADIMPEGELTSPRRHRLEQEYRRMLSVQTREMKRLVEQSAYSIFLLNGARQLAEFVPIDKWNEWTLNSQETYDYFTGNDREETYPELQALCQRLVQEGERALKETTPPAFIHWLETKKSTKRPRVLGNAKNKITQALSELALEYSDPFPKMEGFGYYDREGTVIMNEQVDPLQALFKAPLSNRQEFLNVYEHDVDAFFSLRTGLEQLLSGGPITNPEASPVSVLQNHYHFPNLQYSEATMAKVREIHKSLAELLNTLPDISDLAAPTYIRKKKDHTYAMVELPKNPLDITFGNDSGCCIFVPEELEELQNGIFVPFYLDNYHVRLFAVYRVDASEANGTDAHTLIEQYQQGQGNVSSKKVQRMGMVLAFDTVGPRGARGEKILTCNSLELSRFGIAGGNATIQKIVDYAEQQWLIGYAQQNGYRGVTMGRHSYNTSVNFSSQREEVVPEQLEFVQKKRQFHSDIFVWDEEHKVMKTRPGSCYWLWRG